MEVMFTITGIRYHMEAEDLNPGQEIILKKEPNNKYDTEAIAVYTNDFVQIGYIANSCNTKAKGTYSAGRLYDKIGDSINAKILVIIYHTAIGVVEIEDDQEG